MYQGIAFRTAYLLSASAADAEEAVQIGIREGLDGAAALPARGAVQAVAPRASSRTRPTTSAAPRAGRRRCGCAPTVAHPPEDAAPSPEGAALEREQRDELLAAVNRLDDRDRDVLTCRYLLELSEEETATVLDVRRGTVKSRTARALGRLRQELEA